MFWNPAEVITVSELPTGEPIYKVKLEISRGGVAKVKDSGIRERTVNSSKNITMVRDRHNRLATEVSRIQGRLGSAEESDGESREPVRLNTLKIPKREMPNPNLNMPSGDAGNGS